MLDARGFTLTELMIAVAVSAIVAGTCYVLIDAGLSMHDRGAELGVSAVGLAGTAVLLRADVAGASGVDHAAADSLVLDLPNGDAVEWAARRQTGGLAIFRSIDDGSGFTERPKRAMALLLDTDHVPASVDFSQVGSEIVRARLVGGDRCLTVDASRWTAP